MVKGGSVWRKGTEVILIDVEQRGNVQERRLFDAKRRKAQSQRLRDVLESMVSAQTSEEGQAV